VRLIIHLHLIPGLRKSGVIPPLLLNAKMASTGAYIFYANIYPHNDVSNKEKLRGFYNLKMEYTLELLPIALYIKSIQLSMKRERCINKIRNMIFVTSLSLIKSLKKFSGYKKGL
jgi:hypothetical protein